MSESDEYWMEKLIGALENIRDEMRIQTKLLSDIETQIENGIVTWKGV